MSNKRPKGLVGTSLTRQSRLNRDKFRKIMCRVPGPCATCGKRCKIGSDINYYYELRLITHTTCKNPMEGA